MGRILKLFCTGKDQDKLAEVYRLIERYDGFALADVPKAKVSRLSKRYLFEDITDLYKIRVDHRVIDTSRPRLDAEGKLHAHRAYTGSKSLPRGPHHYLVQFLGPIKATWLRRVKRAGGELRTPQGDFTYIVRADQQQVKRIAALPEVRWVGHLPHANRVAASVLERIARRPDDTSSKLPRTRVFPGVYTVEFFGPQDVAKAAALVKKQGFEVLTADRKAAILVVRTKGTTAPKRRRQIEALAAIHGIRKIRERTLDRPSNNVAAGIMGTTAAMGNQGLGLSGQGEYIGICDTGLDTGNPQTVHPDFANRVWWIKSYPINPEFNSEIKNPGADDGPADLDSGHGSHVAGSVLGSGSASSGLPGLAAPIRGLAYRARLVFQAVEQELDWKNPGNFKKYGRYLLAGIPTDLKQLFSEAYNRGARIHSNSWGGGDPGAYDEQCSQLDEFVWRRKDFCVVVAAGNDGTDFDGDGKINPMSVTSPGTAKNCITIGACENGRPNFNSETYGKWWPKDYPAAPFKNDPMADDVDEVVPFSSRGPTLDGRVKPDVVAPGTFILSTRSTMIAANNTAWAAFPPSKLYFFMGGTSMATPLTAGAVALVRQYLRTKKKIARPSAALLKAALIAGAARLPGTAPKGTVLDNHQGYGRVNLDNVLAPAQPATVVFLDVKPGLKTGQIQSIPIKVKSDQAPLRVVLAYSDFPGPSLVNNLNLIATAPDGSRFVGNQAAGGAATLDGKNNVEVVHVPKPAAGAWKIDVVGSNIPSGAQDYALVYMGRLG